MANFYVNTTEVVHKLPNNDRPKFYMFGVPSYTNMGDQAVSLAERKYIEGADVKIMDRFFRHRELPDSENFSKPGFHLKTA